ncbi:hypothetical protein N7470_007312 [Penicillium chermesinum]|nr:hypothetical protein N7470_007312 [Penicillium chermesinum]
MNASDPSDVAELAKSKAISHDATLTPALRSNEDAIVGEDSKAMPVSHTAPIPTLDLHEGHDRVYATEHDLQTLRRVADKVPWAAYTVAFVEWCERFSYYGTTAVFVNFIQRPLPANSTTGALPAGADHTNGVPGALGMGQRASTGLTLFNQFWSYVMPLVGAFIADQHWGRFKTIFSAIAVALMGHTILLISAIPQVIASPHGSIACFAVGLVIMGIGTGGFKPNITTLIAEQYREERPFIRVLASGERVVVDPAATVARIHLYFYLMVNLGSLVGQISMVYAERYIGFWLSFLLPTVMFLLCPGVLFLCRKRYHLVPPTGSVYSQAFRLWRLSMKGSDEVPPESDNWDRVKPSRFGPEKPAWMTFDDEWVDEVRRGLQACKLFLWLPLFWLSYNQMLNNLTSQAATMKLGGVPNDIINNLNPFALVILIPIFDQLLYPGLRRLGFNFTPIKRITGGFIVAGLSMIAATVTQYYIYRLEKENPEHTDISVWVQVAPYVLGAISEIFASVTSLEYAFTKAPRNMRSLVQAIAQLMNAFSSAIGQAFVSLSEDPLLVWNYAVVAILAFVGAVGFWLTNYKLDRVEDTLNLLPQSQYQGREKGDAEE